MSEDDKKSRASNDDDSAEAEEGSPYSIEAITSSSTFRIAIVLGIFVAILIAGSLTIFYIYRALTPEMGQCLRPPPVTNYFKDVDVPTRTAAQKPLVLKNAKIFANATEASLSDILVINGKIDTVAASGQISSKKIPVDAQTVDLGGRWVTPGLIDFHSHVGLLGPMINDSGEATNPATPFVRAIDGLHPNDPTIEEMRAGGITTALVLPDSDNVFGGESVHIKTKGKTVGNMVIVDAPRGIKMACGENPTSTYKARGEMPTSRMGVSWVARREFEKAFNLLLKQEAWDCDLRNKYASIDRRPSSLALEGLVGALNRQSVLINIHCYEVNDLEAMIRVAKEFGFQITAVHHAVEAYKIADVLKKNNITVVAFADNNGVKKELSGQSVKAPVIYNAAGVPFAIKSDHPITHARDLIYQAAKVHYYGADAGSAMNSVTSVPAIAMGLGNRIGKIEAGFDADIIAWDRYPLLLGATPYQVYIDGDLYVSNNLASRQVIPTPNPAPFLIKGVCTPSKTSATYAIEDVTVYFMDESGSVLPDVNVVVTNGMINCIGKSCVIPANYDIYDIENGILVPGLIDSTSNLGIIDIKSEPDTNDGSFAGYSEATGFVYAKDGVRMDSASISGARKSGVTTAITHRTSTSLIGGLSSAFHLTGAIVSDALIKDAICLHINLGNSAKKNISSTSAQISTLRNLFQSAAASTPFDQAKRGELPVCLHAHQADDIAQVLNLQHTFNFSLIIIGGAEAHLLADKLAAQHVSVVLTPYNRVQNNLMTWDQMRAQSWDFNIGTLANAGVKVALGSGNHGYLARNLRWIAGMMSNDGKGNFTMQDALSLVTKNVAEIFNLEKFVPGTGRIQLHTKANFVLFDSSPLTFTGTPKLVAVGQTVECNPEQN